MAPTTPWKLSEKQTRLTYGWLRVTRSLVAVEETSGVLLSSAILVIARVLEEVTSPITASTLSLETSRCMALAASTLSLLSSITISLMVSPFFNVGVMV